MARKPKFVPSAEWTRQLRWPRQIVLSIDASISSTGWAVMSFAPDHPPIRLASGNLTTDPGEAMNQESIIRRTGVIFQQARLLFGTLDHYGPIDRVAIEMAVPGSFGVASQSGAMSAVALYAAVLATHEVLADDYAVSFSHPTHVKRIVTGDGRADKQTVKASVFRWLDIEPFRTNTDVTDAIAVALTDVIDNFDLGVPDDY